MVLDSVRIPGLDVVLHVAVVTVSWMLFWGPDLLFVLSFDIFVTCTMTSCVYGVVFCGRSSDVAMVAHMTTPCRAVGCGLWVGPQSTEQPCLCGFTL